MSTKRSRRNRKRKQPSSPDNKRRNNKSHTDYVPPRKKARVSNRKLNKSYSGPTFQNLDETKNENENEDNYSGPECPEPYVPPNTPISPRSQRGYNDSQSMGLYAPIDEELEGEQQHTVDDNDSFDVDHERDSMHYHSNRNNQNNDNESNISYESYGYISNHSGNHNGRKETPSLHTSQDSISPGPASSLPSTPYRNQITVSIVNAAKNGRYSPPSATQRNSTSANNNTNHRRKRRRINRQINHAFNNKGWLLYIVFGFMIGCLIMFAGLAFMDIMDIKWKCVDTKGTGSFPLELPKFRHISFWFQSLLFSDQYGFSFQEHELY